MKETELQNTSETSKTEVQNLSAQDKARKHRKTAKAAISFIVMILLLVALFFAAVNIGSLKVSFPELLKGLFVEYNEDVATIYDLRFPRIVISMLAGAAIAVSGVLFQAVLKNPLADPGIIGISSGASFAAVLITAFAPTLFFFTPLFAFLGGVIAFVLVYSLSWKGGLSPLRIILVGVAVDAMFTGLSSALNSMNGGNMSGVAAIVNGNITMKKTLPKSMERFLAELKEKAAAHPQWMEQFYTCYANTLDTTVKKMEDGTVQYGKTISILLLN